MTPLSIIGALSALPLVLAHMRMTDPSPLRDPDADPARPGEIPDWNMLSPLNADGSNFACKGYHLNTPLNTVATYAAGSKQTLRLKGSATHGGGSCQISLSCDGGSNFQVIQSIMGGCPLSDSYNFTVPSDIPAASKCLLAWTWFNKIGNREMYMNCAVVDITNKKSKRDSQAAAAKALSRYPDLFVANLANINSCKIPETTDVIFDNPGKQVAYGNGDSASMEPSFDKGQCTGKGSKNAGKGTLSSNSGGGGGSGQWTQPAKSKPTQGGDCATKIQDGQWHPECYGGNSRTIQRQQQPAQRQQQQQRQQQNKQQEQQPSQIASKSDNNKPGKKVQQELDTYLATLYGPRLARRKMAAAADYTDSYKPKEGYSVQPAVPHKHTENCKHESSGYPAGSHYHNTEDLDPYPEDGVDYSNKNVHSTQDSQYHKDPDSAYKRTARQRRWTSYTKRADDASTPIRYHRGDETSSYSQQASNQASAQASTQASTQTSTQASTQASTQTSTQTSTQASTHTSDDSPAQKVYEGMSPEGMFDAFLRRMVELSSNMASLIKYAAASTVNLPFYPPACFYSYAGCYNADPAQSVGASAERRRARRGVVYPGPSVDSISAPGEAIDADDGFKAWFPNLVQGLMTKRQLVDPVTSEASAEADDSIGLLDALFAGFWKAIGDPFNIYGDDAEDDQPRNESLSLSEPNFYTEEPDWGLLNDMLTAPESDKPDDFPDFEILDLDGNFLPPPQILAPESPVPELDSDWPSDEPSIIILVDPIDDSTLTDTSDPTEIYPGSDISPLSPCIEPIPQVGFNSCWGGCNHTAEEIAAHEVYLENFAQEQAAYEECLLDQALNALLPPSPIWSDMDDPSSLDDDDSNDGASLEAPDASGRRPRPGMSQPLIPYPSNETSGAPYSQNETASPGNGTLPPVELQPYRNKTLGELVSEILNGTSSLGPLLEDPAEDVAPGLTPVPSDSSDDLPPIDQPSEETNPLQEAADLAEEGVTVPKEPVFIDPNALETIADALPWLMGPGPVVTSDVPEDVDGQQ